MKKFNNERVAAFTTEPENDFKSIVKSKGFAVCPTCNRTAKEYKRKLTPKMCVALIEVLKWYRHNPDTNITTLDYFNVKELFKDRMFLSIDFSKLQYWDLVEAKGFMRKDKFIRNKGWYRISENGIKFAQREVAIPTIALVYDNVVNAHLLNKESVKTIDKILAEEGIDYEQLINPNSIIQIEQ
jgi:hypothetical protein